jgi:hypothetical protein
LHRNGFLEHVIEGKMDGKTEVTERRGKRRKQLLDDINGNRRYWKLKVKALDRLLCRIRFGSSCDPVVRLGNE